MRAHQRLLPTALFMILFVLPSFSQACNSNYPGCAQFQKLLMQLPLIKRRILEDNLKRVDRSNKKLRDEKRQLEDDLNDLLAAPEFDKRTYLDKSAKLGTLRAKMRATLDDVITLVAAQFTPEERSVLIKMRMLEQHGDLGEWSRDDGESNHQPTAEQ